MKKNSKKKKAPPKKNATCREGMEVQSVLFDAARWTPKTARAWLKEHKMAVPRTVREGNYLRYRQASPARFEKSSFKTKSIAREGVKFIVACPKRGAPVKRTRKMNARLSVPGVLVELGKAVEIELDGTLMKFRGFVLCSNTSGTRLFILRTRGKKATTPQESKTVSEARKLYGAFTEFSAERAYKVKLSGDDFELIGKADHIVYESDKWTGRKVEYIHEFKRPPKVYVNKAKSIIVLTGPIKVRKEGITG